MTDDQYILRCLEIAELGMGNVSPNPMVGCVIVHDDSIIGEGYHMKFGQAHAEVNAVNAVYARNTRILLILSCLMLLYMLIWSLVHITERRLLVLTFW